MSAVIMQKFPIEYTDFNNELRCFLCRYTKETNHNGETTHSYRVAMDEDALSEGKWFELDLLAEANGLFRIIWISNNNHQEYSRKGLPQALIPLAASQLGVIVSSSNLNVGNPTKKAIFRTESATNVWDRLVEAGQAHYDRALDTYRTI